MKELKEMLSKKKRTFYTGTPTALEEVSREVKNEKSKVNTGKSCLERHNVNEIKLTFS